MGEEITRLDLDNHKLFIDKTTVCYGESGTGKSTIIVNILHALKPHVDQIVVFAPTDPQNKTYSCGVVPLPLIHYNVSLKVLQDIWDRQEIMAAVYKRANDPDTLEKLFRRLRLPHVEDYVKKAEAMKTSTVEKIKEQYMDPNTVQQKTNSVTEKFNELMMLIYKRFIAENKAFLAGQKLDENERFSLEYLGFNPRMVVIFDDCTAMLQDKEIKKSKVFKDFFTRGRWAYMTIIFAIHNDKNMEQDMRKNTFVNIFTSKSCAMGYFMNKTNYFDSETIAKAKEGIRTIQEPKVGHSRLAYMREENKFYTVQANLFPKFCFCSDTVQKYCNRIKDNGSVSVDRNNKFYDTFFKK